MRKPLMGLLAIGLLLTGCGGWSDARVNPRNWFGNSNSVPVAAQANPDAANPLIPRRSNLARNRDAVDSRVAIAAVTQMRIDPTTTGAIIYVTGIAARQGAHDAEIRLDPTDEDTPSDVLSYTFVVDYPKDATAVGTERTRTIHEAHSLSNHDLRGIRLIRIHSQQNTLETRRR